ncbi:MAG: hypothetical protein JWQ14_842 [Adhaeribacter sp.]|nr:hypothetical protein [Adhaeribacter sp.]
MFRYVKSGSLAKMFINNKPNDLNFTPALNQDVKPIKQTHLP